MSGGQEIVVTGGAGMIGSNLVKRLRKAGHHVRVIDNLSRGRMENLIGENGDYVIDIDADFHDQNLTQAGTFEHLFQGADLIFHLADVVGGIAYVFNNQGELFRQNTLINSNAIAAARSARPGGFVYVGTACSYPASMQSSLTAQQLREEDAYPAWPESAYGWSKLMGEYEALLMGDEAAVPVTVLRLHNVYGAPCDYDPVTGQVIPSLIRKAINYPQEQFVVWGSGDQCRAFVHIDDVLDGIIAAWQVGIAQEVVQLGPGECTSIREIAEKVVAISGKPIEIEFDRSKPEGDRSRAADYSKATKLLGWEPRVTLDEGLSRLYEWIQLDMKHASKQSGPLS